MHHHLIGVWIAVAVSLFGGVAISLWIVLFARKTEGAEEPTKQNDLSPIVRSRIPGTRL
jgi:hypothetical protein